LRAVDEQRARAELRGMARGGQAGRAGTNHDQVKRSSRGCAHGASVGRPWDSAGTSM